MTADFFCFFVTLTKKQKRKMNLTNHTYNSSEKYWHILPSHRYSPTSSVRAYIGSVRPSLYTIALTGATGAARQAVQGRKILLEYGKLKSKQLFWALLPAHSDLKLRIPFGNVMVKTKHVYCTFFLCWIMTIAQKIFMYNFVIDFFIEQICLIFVSNWLFPN